MPLARRCACRRHRSASARHHGQREGVCRRTEKVGRRRCQRDRQHWITARKTARALAAWPSPCAAIMSPLPSNLPACQNQAGVSRVRVGVLHLCLCAQCFVGSSRPARRSSLHGSPPSSPSARRFAMADDDAEMEVEGKEGPRFVVKKWNAVTFWSWDICTDTCAICRNKLYEPSIEAQANPGLADDAGYSIAWGCCGHVFHLDCISRWLKTRSVCPLCNREWECVLARAHPCRTQHHASKQHARASQRLCAVHAMALVKIADVPTPLAHPFCQVCQDREDRHVWYARLRCTVHEWAVLVRCSDELPTARGSRAIPVFLARGPREFPAALSFGRRATPG